ncbi:cell division cycle protein-like protein 23 [Stachybotrys elegans]|uniref:Cell division cycle protein-like protein 23 n=1 Tax=Stachybotrys elegans TaxID=80388 RepID=A0A8K0T635_9HYPO|nr:cell division cycle protein-like protein 23 [Stachybotrys elegans]
MQLGGERQLKIPPPNPTPSWPWTSHSYSIMDLSRSQILQLRCSLQQAVTSCSERCLYQSSKWAAEMLNALPENDDDEMVRIADTFTSSGASLRLQELRELPKYLQAKALFDCHEYQRCAAVFLPSQQPMLSKNTSNWSLPPSISQKALFLSLYALFMAGEKSKNEQLGQILGPFDNNSVANPQLMPIKIALHDWFERAESTPTMRETSQGWLEYLYGIVLARDSNHDHAIYWLLKSVALYPWNWGAWLELMDLIRDAQHLKQIQAELSPTLMGLIFSICCRQKMHLGSPSLIAELTQVQSIFPNSRFLQGLRALTHYQMRDTSVAATVFWSTLLSEPQRLDFIDHYSNALYIIDDRERLAFIAQLCSNMDRNRPETCCVMGNYYSLTGRHEDAIELFRKALILDRSNAGAWTLLGHEYFHLQNTHAAIECYRRAVCLNQHDYRSFVGLGQCYESMDKGTFAVYYHRRAAKLRPSDAGLWQSVSQSLVGLYLLPQAAKALMMALVHIGPSPISTTDRTVDRSYIWSKRIELLYQLANIYDRVNNRSVAMKCLELGMAEYSVLQHDRSIDESTMEDINNDIVPQARLLQARWAVDIGDFVKAHAAASQVDEESEHGADARRILELCAREQDTLCELGSSTSSR